MAQQADLAGTTDPNVFIRREAMLSWKWDFSHTQAMREKMYEEFAGAMNARTYGMKDATMDRTTDVSVDRMLGAGADSSRAIAPEWVDLQLDADLLDGREGGPAGVVSISQNTWAESAGKGEFEAWDLDANPSGILPGNWTSIKSVVGERVESRPQ